MIIEDPQPCPICGNPARFYFDGRSTGEHEAKCTNSSCPLSARRIDLPIWQRLTLDIARGDAEGRGEDGK
jgi:hypothetical protein